jgi:hypothetical protein
MPILKHCDCDRGAVCEVTGTIMHASNGNCLLGSFVAQEFDADGAVVGRIESFLIRDEVAYRYLTSPEVLALICHFEETGELLAGTYTLLPPVVN